MTRGRTPPTPSPTSDPKSRSGGGGSTSGGGGGAAMRIIVPLQGVVQGRGGIVLGSLIPCALFYFFQLYLKRNRPPAPPTSPRAMSPPSLPSSSSSGNLAELPRSLSRTMLASPRSSGGGSAPAQVSARASSIAKSADSTYYAGLRRCSEDPYDPVTNPEGVIQLGLAENKLSLDLLWEWLSVNLKGSLLDEERPELSISGLAAYQPFDGFMDLKMAFASFMGQVMRGSEPVTFNANQLVLTAGATPAIETLSFCLADPGNAFLVPTPYYPGFDRDIKYRTGVELIPVPCRSTDNFNLSIPALERAYSQAKKRGIKVRAVLVTNPANPVGNLLSRETAYELVEFVRDKNIHLISDEVYAGSIYTDNDEFVSMAEVLETEDMDRSRVHIIYGLSKDLSLPGFRVGAIYSFNQHVLAAAKRLSRFSAIPAPVQRLLVSMLSDTRFIESYLTTNRLRLRKMHDLVVDGLKQLGVECAPSSGGFYCWADMSKFIRPYSEKGELELWEKLLNVAKVNATPGSCCHCIEPGWFRVCFTTLTAADVPVVMNRIKSVIESNKPNS